MAMTSDDERDTDLIAVRDGPAAAAELTRPAGLDRERILQAAIDFIDEHGLAALTMRRLGASLGVEAMALYRYVPGREDLLDGVVSGAAALAAVRADPGVAAWLAAGHRSSEPAHGLALAELGLSPVLDLGMRLGEGTGALLAQVGAADDAESGKRSSASGRP